MNKKMILNCPMPKLDFDQITLGHGSGGLLTNKLLDSGVFSLFSNEYLDTRHDGAVFQLSGSTAMTTDSFVVDPVFFPGGNIGELAINGTINDLAMCGAVPEFISVAFILEEGLKMDEFWEILVSMKFAAEDAGVKIVTGDTKVVERGKGDKIFINTTGLGKLHAKAKIGESQIKKGDKIIVSGEIAHHGIAIMSVREGLQFETEIESDTKPLHSVCLGLLDQYGNDVHLLRDATRGGIATVLAEIARSSHLSIDLEEKKIPIHEQVKAACEILGLDPLYVANEGVFVCILNSEIAEEAVEILRNQLGEKHASIIGEIVDDHAGKVILKSSIGGSRVVNMLPGEQLPRIC
jgi:hydrogenase expression/formation protein HypE